MTPTPAVAIVVVTHNSAALLDDFFAAVGSALGERPVQVILVDNDSADDTIERAQALWPDLVVVATGTNRGFAAAINRGVEVADPAAHVLILNPDVRLHRHAIDRLADVADRADVGLVAPLLEDETGRRLNSIMTFPEMLTPWGQIAGLGVATRLGISRVETDAYEYTRPRPVEWATGGAIMMAAGTEALVGPWSEHYFMYAEETEYCRRVRDAGLTMMFEPSASAVRCLDGDPNPGPLLYALMMWNDYRFFRAYHGPVSSTVYRLGQIVFLASRSPRRFERAKQSIWALLSDTAPARRLLAERLADGA